MQFLVVNDALDKKARELIVATLVQEFLGFVRKVDEAPDLTCRFRLG
jgi:hypothetical protein